MEWGVRSQSPSRQPQCLLSELCGCVVPLMEQSNRDNKTMEGVAGSEESK